MVRASCLDPLVLTSRRLGCPEADAEPGSASSLPPPPPETEEVRAVQHDGMALLSEGAGGPEEDMVDWDGSWEMIEVAQYILGYRCQSLTPPQLRRSHRDFQWLKDT